MTSIIAPKQTVSYCTYKHAVENSAGIPNEFIQKNIARIDRAYRSGEPVWMIADELKMVFRLGPPVRPTKTPRQLALRSVRCS